MSKSGDLTKRKEQGRVLPVSEQISFVPHPRTLTCAGDYEYWAAQGRSPLPYALGELIDNSLRALLSVEGSMKRTIVISILLSGSSKGLISVWDNGIAMSKKQLNDWAVMNLAMEDREGPLKAVRDDSKPQTIGDKRFLTGNLSYFGVGSKNAAFYIGRSVKMSTKQKDSPVVHELKLEAEALEQRYQEGQEVYTECLVRRSPGDASTLSKVEEPFRDIVGGWIREEESGPRSPSGSQACDPASFTRVTIADLKSHLLEEIEDDADGSQLCRQLSHLYHYYLHGAHGRRGPSDQPAEGIDGSEGDRIPDIVVECWSGQKLAWQRRLVDVDDDLESQYLQAKKAEMQFTLEVPGKGEVAGVLWYFPCEQDKESLPLGDERPALSNYNMTQADMGMSQLPGQTQQQCLTQRPGNSPRGASDDEGDLPLWRRSPVPQFEAFWQGRLIPGARIDSLPFIEGVRCRRSAAARDMLPDEAFMRLRGALFFGPEFLVTRNKLTFRDNLKQLLDTATSAERSNLERKFREWLTRCHAELDKSICFKDLADSATQAAARASLGEGVTAFDKMSDGNRVVQKGDVVHLALKPAVMGRVLFFSVDKVVREEGVYSDGQVTVCPLPEEVHGRTAQRTVRLRRMESVATPQEIEEFSAKECAKLPASLRLEPIRFATGLSVDFMAGEALPETGVSICNGAGQTLIRGVVAGTKQTFTVMQRLWRLKADSGIVPSAPGPAKKKGKKGKARRDLAPCQQEGVSEATAELVLEVENKTPLRDSFKFARLTDGMCISGNYVLQYEMQPSVPGSPLTLEVQLTVAPGPTAQVLIQGDRRATAAVKEFMLGEILPPVTLVFQDEYGNESSAGNEHGPACLEILGPAGTASQNVVVPDLRVAASQEATGSSTVLLDNIQVLGTEGESSATSIFAGRTGIPLTEEEPEGQRSTGHDGTMAAEVRLCVTVGALAPVSIPLRLRPGAPHSLMLLPGHPWASEGEEMMLTQIRAEVARVTTGNCLPAFHAVGVDFWGNRTSPCHDLSYTINGQCAAFMPESFSVPVGADGVALIEGLQAKGGSLAIGPPVPLILQLETNPLTDPARAAVEAAGSPLPLQYDVAIEASSTPAAIVLVYNGQDLSTKHQVDEGGEGAVATLEGIPAGSMINGLAFYLVDDAGRVATSNTAGKVQVSWLPSFKKVDTLGGPLSLPALQAPDELGDVGDYMIRFKPNKLAILEISLNILVTPASPAQWQLRFVEEGGSQRICGQCDARVGRPFAVEVEAVDEFGNRCTRDTSPDLPQPMLKLEADQAVVFEGTEEGDTLTSPDGGDVSVFKVSLKGSAGAVTLHAYDTHGEEGMSLLSPDALQITLAPGPPASLAFDVAQPLHSTTRGVLSQLRVLAVDVCGNPTLNSDDTGEVMLQPSALATDGSGAATSISAAGGNKSKMKAGVAVFRDVCLRAENAGVYAVMAKSSSRKVAGEATLLIQLEATNSVTSVAIFSERLAGTTLTAGEQTHVCVMAQTEDGVPLPHPVAEEGLVLRLLPPGGGRDSALTCTPTQDANPDGQEGFFFETPELSTAGAWTLTAEYTETRPELVKALAKRDTCLRSSAIKLNVAAGAPCTLSLESSAAPTRVTATNGRCRDERVLLEGVVLQLRDAHDNAVAKAGIAVACNLAWATQELGELPLLEEDGARGITDKHGRVSLGDILISEGTGKLRQDENHANNAAQAAELDLLLQSESLLSSRGEPLVLWQCAVLFTDNSALGGTLKQLNGTHQAKIARRDEILDLLRQATSVREEAEGAQASASRRVAALQEKVGLDIPDNVRAVQAHLERLQAGADAAVPSTVLEARHGQPGKPMTAAIDRCLDYGDQQVVGVFAGTATVSDEALSRVLAAHFRGYMSVVIVANNACRERLTKKLTRDKLPIPDMLAITHMQGYSGGCSADTPGQSGAAELCHELLSAACRGSDHALPLPLPHTRVLAAKKGSIPCALGPTDWPVGCCGYAFNLVRPVIPGHRASVLYAMLGQTLVFDTLENAAAYREMMTQVLKSSCADIITLDGRRISGKGIVSGSSFQAVPLEEAMFRFGSTPTADRAAAEQLQQQGPILEELIEALQEREQADSHLREICQAASATEEELRVELQRLEEDCQALDAQLCTQAGSQHVSVCPSYARGAGANRKKKGRRRDEESIAEDGEETAAGDIGGESEAVVPPPKGPPRLKRRRVKNMQV